MKCSYCGKEEVLPFKCPYCGEYFCSEHRLPEHHECLNLHLAYPPSRKPVPVLHPIPEVSRVEVRYETKKASFKEIINFLIGAVLVWAVGASMLRFHLSDALFLLNSVIFLMAFILHEYAHKLAAARNGLHSEFQLNLFGAFLTFISIFLPLKLIAPGAVVIYGYASPEKMGRVAAYGPLTNIILGLVMLPVLLSPYGYMISVAFYLNAFIALFNLVPFGVLDGRKIMAWNRPAWAATFVLSLAFFVLGYFSL